MEYIEILFSAEGEIAFLTLNRPEKINALSKHMIGDIIGTLNRVSADESVKVVIIKAASRNFFAGHNMKEMFADGIMEYKFIFDQCAKMMQMIHEISQPVNAQVQGVATEFHQSYTDTKKTKKKWAFV